MFVRAIFIYILHYRYLSFYFFCKCFFTKKLYRGLSLLAWRLHKSWCFQKEVCMSKKDLIKKIAQLESLNDHLTTELSYIDQLMRLVGFAGGIETVKLTAKELYESEKVRESGDDA